MNNWIKRVKREISKSMDLELPLLSIGDIKIPKVPMISTADADIRVLSAVLTVHSLRIREVFIFLTSALTVPTLEDNEFFSLSNVSMTMRSERRCKIPFINMEIGEK